MKRTSSQAIRKRMEKKQIQFASLCSVQTELSFKTWLNTETFKSELGTNPTRASNTHVHTCVLVQVT